MATALGGVVDFLKAFGFFDIVLPFLLIFTITFAVLEKSKIFGADGNGKANQRVDAMVAFTIALFFVAIPSLVQSIQISLPQIMMLLVVLVMFMLLIGSLSSGEHPLAFFGKNVDDSFKFWRIFFYLIIFLGVSAIFLNSFGWLDPLLDYVLTQWDQTLIVSLIFLVIIVVTIIYVVSDKKESK